jgi:hypothetical protein
MAKVSKLVAARRQLDCSIRLYFENEDLLVVHALVSRGIPRVFELQPARDDYKQLVERTIDYLGWRNFNELTNFLKHADRDRGEEKDEPNEGAVQIGIGFAAMLYRHSQRP